jgi:hypothetical protein
MQRYNAAKNMKRYEAIFAQTTYKFTAANPSAANEIAKQYAQVNNLGYFKLIQIGL